MINYKNVSFSLCDQVFAFFSTHSKTNEAQNQEILSKINLYLESSDNSGLQAYIKDVKKRSYYLDKASHNFKLLIDSYDTSISEDPMQASKHIMNDLLTQDAKEDQGNASFKKDLNFNELVQIKVLHQKEMLKLYHQGQGHQVIAIEEALKKNEAMKQIKARQNMTLLSTTGSRQQKPIDTPGFTKIPTLADGNCFTNAFALLLLTAGQADINLKNSILSFLNDNNDTKYDDSIFQSPNQFEHDISLFLKNKLYDWVETDLRDNNDETKSKITNIRENMIGFYGDKVPIQKGSGPSNAILSFDTATDQEIKQFYLSELSSSGQWLGLETIHFISDMLYSNHIIYEPATDDETSNGVCVFAKEEGKDSVMKMGNESARFGLFNPNAGHWTLLKNNNY